VSAGKLTAWRRLPEFKLSRTSASMTQRKLSILYLDTGFKFDVEETYRQKLEFISKKFDGNVITFGQVGTFQFGEFTVRSFKILPSKFVMFLRALAYSLMLIMKSRNSEKKVDIIVSYDPLNTGLLGVIISRLTNTPLLVEVNGDYTNWTNYSNIASKWQRQIKRLAYLKIESFVLKRANGIKLLYPEQLDYFRPQLSGRNLVRCYPNFLDVSEFRNLGETQKAVIVGFPFDVKGIDIAINAFKSISAANPEWSLEILGWYPDREKELLDQCIGNHPKIRHHPPISRREMPGYIGSCGVVVCASRTEGFPRVVKEAMHASKPCVVSSVGGLPHAIVHGENGLIFKSEDTEQLAVQLNTMLSDTNLRARLGETAREFAEHEYSLDTYLNYFSDFIHDILRKSPARE